MGVVEDFESFLIFFLSIRRHATPPLPHDDGISRTSHTAAAATADNCNNLPSPIINPAIILTISCGMEGPVVSISFRKVRDTGEINYPFEKMGKPFLEIEVLGSSTLRTVGQLLFEHYMEELLGEGLTSHVWRFEPCENGRYKAFNPTLPLLSKDMTLVQPPYGNFEEFHDDEEEVGPGRSKTKYHGIEEGTDMIFFYDEGSPTRVAVTIDRIFPIPGDKTAGDYPTVKEEIVDQETSRKRQLASEAPVLTIRMDEAYPFLRDRLFKDEQTKFDFGNGSDPNKGAWALMWGGHYIGNGLPMSYTSSLECLAPFSDMDEAWLCFEKGIEKQVSPGYPSNLRRKEVVKPDGEIEIQTIDEDADKKSGMPKFTVHVRPYPMAVPPAQYKSEYVEDWGAMAMCSSSPEREARKVRRSWSRWAFNFALPNEEVLRTAVERFSFSKQFPKCALWLTGGGKTSYHWMTFEMGVLKAVKGKAAMRKPENVVHQTARHAELHAMFAEMEELIDLPKAWVAKAKKARKS